MAMMGKTSSLRIQGRLRRGGGGGSFAVGVVFCTILGLDVFICLNNSGDHLKSGWWLPESPPPKRLEPIVSVVDTNLVLVPA